MTVDRDHKQYLRDLFTLEVTTVVVDRIPDDVMYNLPARVRMLDMTMEQSMSQMREMGAAPDAQAQFTNSDNLSERFEMFATMMKSTEAAGEAKTPLAGAAGVEKALPPRMASSDRLMAMADLLRGVPDVDAVKDMPEDKRMALHRLTTIGAHPIAMHTTMSVSGDLLTLIAEDFTGEDKRPLREAHAENIRQAVGWWRAIGEFVVNGLGFILGALKQPSPEQLPR